MKTSNYDLNSLAAELTRQREARKDFVASTAAMEFGISAEAVVTGKNEEGHEVCEMQPSVELRVRGVDDAMTCGKTAHSQFATRTGIPKRYYDRMLTEQPDLLVHNLNTWLAAQPTDQLVRMLDGRCRALLSSRYRPMDNADLATAVLPAFRDHEASVESVDISEDSFYLKAIVPGLREEIAPAGLVNYEWGKGHNPIDVVQAGIVIRNSEVGHAALSISPAVHTVQCTNLATFASDAMRRNHVGSKSKAGDDGDARWLSDNTQRLDDAALWSRVQDITLAALDGRIFRARVEELRKDETSNVLSHLASGGELNQYGLSNAITRASQDIDSYDRASEFERFGGEVIELKPQDWSTLVNAS